MALFHPSLLSSPRDKSYKSQFRITALEERDSSGDSEYWMKYNSALSDEKEKVWDGLLDGLEMYR